MQNNKELLYTLALTRINYFNLAGLHLLYNEFGSATVIVENRYDIRDVIPDASARLVEGLKNMDEALKRSEMELEYNEKHKIKSIIISEAEYPQRLRECSDAPLVLFYRGNADLNNKRVINIIGTRHCTVYGQDVVRRFIEDLKLLCPDVLIISGLAYGVDINAHRAALDNGFDTIGVLAHGLDYLYPPRHRDTAIKMLKQGGLLTEFFTQTNADKINFVRRNRIVAGMSDACVLVESASRGGGLITARLTREYDRDVFAFPGRVGDKYSEGCNNLIRDNVAGLISNAEDFVDAMGWSDDKKLREARSVGIERSFFPELDEEELLIVNLLQKINDLQLNMITVKANMPIAKVTSLLFQLEMKGVVKPLAGGVYHLIK